MYKSAQIVKGPSLCLKEDPSPLEPSHYSRSGALTLLPAKTGGWVSSHLAEKLPEDFRLLTTSSKPNPFLYLHSLVVGKKRCSTCQWFNLLFYYTVQYAKSSYKFSIYKYFRQGEQKLIKGGLASRLQFQTLSSL